jgi:hypothetical protein
MSKNVAVKEFDPTAITRIADKLPEVHQVRFDSDNIEVLFNNITKDVLQTAVNRTFGNKVNAEFGLRVVHDESYGGFGNKPDQQVVQAGKGYNTVSLPINELNRNNVCLVESLPKLAKNLQPENNVNISQVIGGLQLAKGGVNK